MRIESQKHRLDVQRADLSGSRFDDVNLSGCDFHNVNMSGCSFDDLNMSGWRVHNVNLAGLKIEKRIDAYAANPHGEPVPAAAE